MNKKLLAILLAAVMLLALAACGDEPAPSGAIGEGRCSAVEFVSLRR